MKKFLSAALSLMLVVSGFAVSSFATRNLTYTAPKATPTIDGTAEALWDTAEWTNVDLPYGEDTDTYGGHALRVKLLWDDTALYVLGEMTCPNTTDDLCYTEVYIDEAGNKEEGYDSCDQQVGLSSTGLVPAYGTNQRDDDVTAVSTITDTGYIVEAAIKWSGETAIAQGSTLGLEFMANIQPDGEFKQAYRWNVDTVNGDAAPWQGTTDFGTLVLGAEPVLEEAPAADAPAEEAPATETAPTETTTAAQTGDATAAFAALAIVALGAAVVVTKKIRG